MSISLPNVAGVYAIFLEEKMVYVGESKSLRERWRDMYDCRNHNFLRIVGNEYLKDMSGFEPATSSRRYSELLTKELYQYLTDNFSFKYLPVDLGRKELEEYITNHPEYSATLMNSKGRRGQKGLRI